MAKEVVRSKKEVANDIKVAQRLITQCDKQIEMLERDLDIRKRMFEFERDHSKIVGDKPEYMTSQGYVDLIIEQKKLNFEASEIQIKDNVERLKSQIKGNQDIIQQLRRNHNVGVKDE